MASRSRPIIINYGAIASNRRREEERYLRDQYQSIKQRPMTPSMRKSNDTLMTVSCSLFVMCVLWMVGGMIYAGFRKDQE